MDKMNVYTLMGFAIAFAGLGIGYLAVIMGIRHDRYKRDLEHKERMRALELGRPLPGDMPWLSTQRIGFLMAVVVPVCLFGFAAFSSQVAGPQRSIWEPVGIVSALAIICGLGVVWVGRHYESEAARAPVEKAAVEDDAYDVVSARG
jgi:hypothetical protein